MDVGGALRQLTNLSCKFFCLPLIQIQLHRSTDIFPFFYCKFDYNRHCSIYHRDVLNIKMDFKFLRVGRLI